MLERDELERECATFCRYLSGGDASAYTRAKYVAAHECGAVEGLRTTSFERAVARLARAAPLLTRMLDAHERVFANGSLLRRKLVLVLALLESKSPPAEELDAPTHGSTLGMFVRMAWLGCVFALSVIVMALALLPVRVACAFGAGK